MEEKKREGCDATSRRRKRGREEEKGREGTTSKFRCTKLSMHARMFLEAKRTLLMRHEAEIKSNAYWLGLLAHLQASSVPGKDLTFLYEAATVEDIYLAYEQLKVDENSLYSCIGIAGAQAAQDIAGFFFFDAVNQGYGMSTIFIAYYHAWKEHEKAKEERKGC